MKRESIVYRRARKSGWRRLSGIFVSEAQESGFYGLNQILKTRPEIPQKPNEAEQPVMPPFVRFAFGQSCDSSFSLSSFVFFLLCLKGKNLKS